MIGITYKDLGKRKYYSIEKIQKTIMLPKTANYVLSLHTDKICNVSICRNSGAAWITLYNNGGKFLGSVIRNPLLALILNILYGVKK